MKLTKQDYPQYAKGSAGYDPMSGRFRDPSGKRISRATYVENYAKVTSPAQTGVFIRGFDLSPQSKNLESFDDIIGGMVIDRTASGKANIDPPPRAWPIPNDIRAAMRLAEYYANTEGDIYNALTISQQMALSRDFSINCPSPEMKRELEELYDIDQLDMMGLMQDIFMCNEIYSNTPTMIIPSGNESAPLAGVTLLNPKYVYIGSPWRFNYAAPDAEKTASTKSVTQYGLLSATEQAWTRATLENEVHPLAYNAFGPQWNEQVQAGMWIDLNPDWVSVLQVGKQRWQRYAMPRMARAFRSISTRKMFEELRRATAEGMKNQIAVANVGSDERPGSVEEVALAQATFGALAGERTGLVVWNGKLHLTFAHMDSVDSLTGNETWHGLTLNIFRQLGIPMRFLSGESPNLGRGGGASDELDIRLFSERLRFMQRQVARWERWFRMRLADLYEPPKRDENDMIIRNQSQAAEKGSMREVMRQTNVVFQTPMVEMSEQIRSYIMPVFNAGGMSIETMHEQAGLNHEVEVARRKQESQEGLDDLFKVRVAFAQESTDKGGTTTRTEQTNAGGRPDGAVDKAPRVEAQEGGESELEPFLALPSL